MFGDEYKDKSIGDKVLVVWRPIYGYPDYKMRGGM